MLQLVLVGDRLSLFEFTHHYETPPCPRVASRAAQARDQFLVAARHDSVVAVFPSPIQARV